MVAELFTDAETVIGFCDRFDDDRDLAAAVELLATVAGQDIEMVADSVVDPDARHGHRSHRNRYDGYKLHISADVDSDLITSAVATRANSHDAAVLDDLVDADPVPVAEVIADTHYGSGPTRQTLADNGIDLVAPAPPATARAGVFSKADFSIDCDNAIIT